VLSHNKTLAAQLYSEFKQFFPHNAVEYYVSYYDYFQPEAYMPVTNTYIEKDLSINDEIEKLRLSATSALLSGRRDVIIVCSVSCIYGIGNPDSFHESTLKLSKGERISRDVVLRKLVDAMYARNEVVFERGNFRVKGDTIDVYVANGDFAYRIIMWDDEVDELAMIDVDSGRITEKLDSITIYPANLFVTSAAAVHRAVRDIQDDLVIRIKELKENGSHLEAARLEERVNFDLEMIKEIGHCSGIENYSRYFDGRAAGTRPFCLMDFFPKDYLLVVDESHVTISQISAMYGGDFSRKRNLVDYGFRLPSALDNRPLRFNEFEELTNQMIYVSATPADYELNKSEGVIVEQIVRPTGLVDPHILVRPTLHQIDDLVAEIHKRTAINERVLVTTLTKRMAEELQGYFSKLHIKSAYIHSDVQTLERVKILGKLRKGVFDVLVGVNLLREGLDLPEVSLVAILDADKEGFLRSERSLTQTSGRAARNINGLVIMYADKITNSMQRTIEETDRRRNKQLEYNRVNVIIPTQIQKIGNAVLDRSGALAYVEPDTFDVAASPVVQYMSKANLQKTIEITHKAMQKAAKDLDFIEASRLRDEMYSLEKLLESK